MSHGGSPPVARAAELAVVGGAGGVGASPGPGSIRGRYWRAVPDTRAPDVPYRSADVVEVANLQPPRVVTERSQTAVYGAVFARF